METWSTMAQAMTPRRGSFSSGKVTSYSPITIRFLPSSVCLEADTDSSYSSTVRVCFSSAVTLAEPNSAFSSAESSCGCTGVGARTVDGGGIVGWMGGCLRVRGRIEIVDEGEEESHFEEKIVQ